MNQIDQALSILKKDPHRNISLINLIENHFYNDILTYGDAVIVKRQTLEKCFIAGKDEHNLLQLLSDAYDKEFFTGNYRRFSSIDESIVPIIKSRFDVKMGNCGDKLFLDDNIPLPKPNRQAQPLTEQEATIINKYWENKDEVEHEYIRRCILNGMGFIIYEGGEPVSWTLTHLDGSLGFLHVREEYRRRGYGKDVMIPLVHEMRGDGRKVFTHIAGTNPASMGLVSGLGFKPVYRICWLNLLI
jgi:8-oxo-dGTP diphosphatase